MTRLALHGSVKPHCTAPRIGRRRLLAAASGLVALSALPLRANESGAIYRPWPKDRSTPPLALPSYDAPPWDLAAAKGQVVLLNFWATWCAPCHAEMPSLELLEKRHEADGLVVIAVNYRETDATIRRFMERMPTMLHIVRDADGAAARAWQVRIFPTTIAIGRDGRAAFSVIGEVDWGSAAARQWIKPLL